MGIEWEYITIIVYHDYNQQYIMSSKMYSSNVGWLGHFQTRMEILNHGQSNELKFKRDIYQQATFDYSEVLSMGARANLIHGNSILAGFHQAPKGTPS